MIFILITLLTLCTGSVLFYVFWFLRTPTRFPSDHPHAFLSPASGKVFSVFHSHDTTIAIHKNHRKVLEFVTDELGNHQAGYHVISIMMTPRDVHIQRSPTNAQTCSVHYRPGLFLNAVSAMTRQKAIWENEAQTIIMRDSDDNRFAVIQIAGFVARKIVSYTHPEKKHAPADPIGFIKLGSQVTVIVPACYDVVTRVGQYLTDGESVIAWKKTS